MEIQFLGATRQVTGSCYCVKAGGLKLMVDYGMFQERSFLDRNWERCCVPVDEIDCVLLTHAHLDHCGRIPRLVQDGYSNPILTTEVSAELARIVLLDSGKIQEEDAAYKAKRHKKEGRRGPHPEIPLYTVEDAEKALPLFESVGYDQTVSLNDRVKVCFLDAGHILGSAMVELTVDEDDGVQRVIFSGDIGQWNKPMVRDPSCFEKGDYVIVESTYGNRNHEDKGDIKAILQEVVNDTVRRGGKVVIPTFAIERAQELMYFFSELAYEDKIPDLPFFLDSPMAVEVTEVFQRYSDLMDQDARELYKTGQPPFKFPGLRFVRSANESKTINHMKKPCVVMAGSGMCTGGRIKHHLVHNISRPESTVLFVGYQAGQTLGRQIVKGSGQVRIHGHYRPVRARIAQLDGLSAHADRDALFKWLGAFESAPKTLFVTHGEEESAMSFAKQVRSQLSWEVLAPKYRQKWTSQ